MLRGQALLRIDPAAPINDLNFEDRKIVEIARAMYDLSLIHI